MCPESTTHINLANIYNVCKHLILWACTTCQILNCVCHVFFGCVECQNYTLVATAATTIKQSRPRLGYAYLNQQINSKPTNHIPTSCILELRMYDIATYNCWFWENYTLVAIPTTTIKQSHPKLGYAYLNQQINSKAHKPHSNILHLKLRMYDTATYNCWFLGELLYTLVAMATCNDNQTKPS